MTTLADPLRRARHAVRASRFREAEEELDRVAEIVRAIPEWSLLSGMTAWRLGDFAGCRTAAIRARDAFRARGDADGEMRAANVAAAGAFALGDLEEAENEFGEALAIARRLSDDLMMARCSNNLGNVWFYLGHHDRAQTHYRRALAGFERVAFDHGVAEAWLNTGFVWRDLDRMDEVLVAANAALEYAERAQSPRVIAQAFSSKGEALAALGDAVLGLNQVERGLELARREGDRLAEAEALRVLGGMARHRGDLSEAGRLCTGALGIVSEAQHPWGIAEVHRDLGLVHLDGGRPKEAAAAFRAAEKFFLRLGSLPRAHDMAQRAEAAAVGRRTP